jgi:hypothetical protein
VSPQSVFWNHPVATVSGKVTYSGHPDLAPLNGPLEAGRSDTSGQIDRLPAMAAELIGRPAI